MHYSEIGLCATDSEAHTLVTVTAYFAPLSCSLHWVLVIIQMLLTLCTVWKSFWASPFIYGISDRIVSGFLSALEYLLVIFNLPRDLSYCLNKTLNSNIKLFNSKFIKYSVKPSILKSSSQCCKSPRRFIIIVLIRLDRMTLPHYIQILIHYWFFYIIFRNASP